MTNEFYTLCTITFPNGQSETIEYLNKDGRIETLLDEKGSLLVHPYITYDSANGGRVDISRTRVFNCDSDDALRIVKDGAS